MKKLSLLFIFCMVSMLAFAQAQSPNYLGSGFSDNDAPPPGGTQEPPRDSAKGRYAARGHDRTPYSIQRGVGLSSSKGSCKTLTTNRRPALKAV